MSLSKTNILEIQFSLRQAVVNCSERCQYQSAKWAAELLDALPDDDLGPATSLTEVFNTQTDPVEMRLERNELPKYLMAKSLLDCHELRRSAAVYLSTNSSEHTIPLRDNVLNIAHGKLPGSVFRKTSQKGLFLASYALLLAGEKEKTEEIGHILGPSDTGAIINKQFAPLKHLHGASTLFSSMLVSSPLCLDFLDYYSSVLHTLGSRSRLAFITHLASAVNRYRPETCCAIGNYYSLSSRHEDAVHYFRLALNLDRNFSSAWTLLGHEYFKLQNSHAAIEAYRRAVDCNNKDYRAFVGLGVVYEGLEKSTFSLHYYRRALALRPDDAELWQMMGGCLTGMERVPQAIEAWKRGIACSGSRAGNDPEVAIHAKCRRIEMFFELAKAYEKEQDRMEAIKCLEIYLGETDRNEEYLGNLDDPLRFKVIFVLGQARLLLARWTGADGDDARARSLASPVGQYSEVVGEEENP
ncbi:hypothetical protein V500_09923 [Pseudogymnoascus sp. VKM F-4518 (FW-2643)]|nr:hypothetical protein V500_09923 [Pseudogymnoascus sp. VKM F-4518 (FW-2643)]